MKPLVALVVLAVASLHVSAAEPKLLWEMSGLVAPESVVHDATRDQLYVSNIGTSGAGATPGDGFVSRVSPDGKLLEQKWVTGLENPKGLALANGRLYVGDDKDLVEIDVASGKILARYAPEDGPGAFNDCTADSDGNVYVCSGRLLTVFRLHEGKFAPWVKLDRAVTGGINGLRAEKDRLLLGGWSVRDAEGKEQVGHISTVAFSDQAIGRLGTTPVCHVDGLEPDGRGGYTVTDWLTGDVLQVSAQGQTKPLMKLVQGSADHTYIASRHQLIIPLMKDNLLRAYQWSPDAN
ncbi:MAG: hypothetical protein ABIV50_08935 [Opitutus sp.]